MCAPVRGTIPMRYVEMVEPPWAGDRAVHCSDVWFVPRCGSHRSELIRKSLELEGTAGRGSRMEAGTWNPIWLETIRKCLSRWVCHRNIPPLQHSKLFPLWLAQKWLLNSMQLPTCH